MPLLMSVNFKPNMDKKSCGEGWNYLSTPIFWIWEWIDNFTINLNMVWLHIHDRIIVETC